MQDDVYYRILKINKEHIDKPDGYHTTHTVKHTFEEVGYCNDFLTMDEAVGSLINNAHGDGEYTIIPIYNVKSKFKP